MKLYFKQKVFSLKHRASIYDENGDVVFKTQGQFSFIPKIHIYNKYDEEVAFIKQKLLSWLPKFYVFINGDKVAEIVKKFTWFKPKYNIKGLDWQIKGDFWNHNFDIFSKGLKIAYVHKVWMSWGNSFEVDVLNDKDVVMVIAMIIALIYVRNENQNNNN